tara:strand:+ start:202 stop:780 length:579 start_codon:yes stop_codon:yes gene_type:complete
MSTALGFSFIEEESENKKKNKKHSRTLRKRSKDKKTPSKIDNLLNSLSATQNKHEEDDELTTFTPLKEDMESFESSPGDSPHPSMAHPSVPHPSMVHPTEGPQTEGFSQLDSVAAQDYYKQYVPYFDKINNDSSHSNKDDLITKLNYMIHLLEDQQDEKTNNVTEELVLYLFLGVFVIFVVDSFARAGKYTR